MTLFPKEAYKKANSIPITPPPIIAICSYTFSSFNNSSLFIVNSAPFIGGIAGTEPVAIKIFLASIFSTFSSL